MSDGMEWERCPDLGPQCPSGGRSYCSSVHTIRSGGAPERTDWTAERADVLARFNEELAKATGDGSRKRQAGKKPPWYIDGAHEGAIFSHLTKWKRGEKVDPDSGAHPLVHLAWRALAIACQENGNVPSQVDM